MELSRLKKSKQITLTFYPPYNLFLLMESPKGVKKAHSSGWEGLLSILTQLSFKKNEDVPVNHVNHHSMHRQRTMHRYKNQHLERYHLPTSSISHPVHLMDHVFFIRCGDPLVRLRVYNYLKKTFT